MTTYEEDVNISNQPQSQFQQLQQLPYEEPQFQQLQQSPSSFQEPPPPPRQQYQPPMPPREQQPFPKQSQDMNVSELFSGQSDNGNYSGFDASDNLSSLDSAFKSFKVKPQSPPKVNNTPKINGDEGNVAPFTASNIDKFSLF
jgi:hypothetical protein